MTLKITVFLLSALCLFQFALAGFQPHSHCANDLTSEVHTHEHETETTSHLQQAPHAESQDKHSDHSEECHDHRCCQIQIALLAFQSYVYFLGLPTHQSLLQNQLIQFPILDGPYQPPKI